MPRNANSAPTVPKERIPPAMRSLMIAVVVLFAVAISAAGSADSTERPLTPEDRESLSVTVYGNGLAFIRDRRALGDLESDTRIAFVGVSPRMISDSAVLSGPFGVKQITYAFDLLTPDALLRAALGNTVRVVRTHPTTGEETVEPATVMSVAGGVVLKYRDRVETGVPGRLVFDDTPADLRPQPTLIAEVTPPTNNGDGDVAELAYLTEGLAWRADYVVVLNATEKRLDLAGRAMLTNVSGTDMAAASIGLVAGNVRRVSAGGVAPAPKAAFDGSVRAMAAEAAPIPQRETLGDLHLHSLPGPITLRDRETRQVALLDVNSVAVEQTYVSEAGAPVFGPSRGAPARPTYPEVRYTFRNAADGDAGQPLPAGVARVYARDSRGDLRLLGEDHLPATPVGEEVELNPGQAFDITVERTQTDFVRSGLPKGVFESAHRVEARNAKDSAVTVRIEEVLTGDWRILEESAPHRKDAANRAVWELPVPAGGAAVLTYRVRVSR